MKPWHLRVPLGDRAMNWKAQMFTRQAGGDGDATADLSRALAWSFRPSQRLTVLDAWSDLHHSLEATACLRERKR